ncbi:uncharacterized protein LOC119314643 [Triticum dicoccoides]|uniref:uncharacterized protein LOC119314643 n=1 Tax=Triticum dicoccoides TaxID=85692 RepID=UPI001891F00E|nr:uncharacterized protein LOC119314643 [Triticum dicoccoides]
MAAWGQDLWNNWSIQILVLLSLGLQLALFLLAGIRRRGAHPLLWFLLWLAYQLGDYTATYALGHLSLKGAAREHPIVAFWAPFLLLHLGGPDNITAYSLEDNKLWKRHLLHVVLQVLAAVYVLYEHISSRGALLQLASVLMFAVGAVEYGEKTWALMLGNLDSIRGAVKKQPPAMHGHFHPQDHVLKAGGHLDEESLVRRAHSLFHICKRAIVDCPVIEDDSDTAKMVDGVKFWPLMETELSLMYDMLYTKAPVIHTWFGYSVRLVSPLVIAASLLLFKLIGKDVAHRGVDVIVTYVLYGGALFMETTALLNALGSSWTFAFLSTTRWRWLRTTALCNERWDRLRRLVAYLHHLVRLGGGSRYKSRRWSRTMGQFNMLHYCTRSDGAFTRPLLGRLAKMVGLGLNEWWNREHYSWAIEMPDHVKDRISKHMEKMYNEGGVNSLGMLRNRWGEEPLVLRKLYHGILKDSLGVEFQECIIIWHIGSDVFLVKSERAKDEDATLNVEAIKVISNYMMFLLVAQPDMLPGLSQNRLYQRTCENLLKTGQSMTSRRQHTNNICAKLKNLFRLHDDPGSSSRVADREELARILCASKGFRHDTPRLSYVVRLAKQLLREEKDGTADSLKLVLDVWTDILVYASNKCSRKAHAEKLNSGGELTTILWLMAEHFYQFYLEELIQKEKDKLHVVEGSN